MICTLSKHYAEMKHYDDSLMLDYKGRVAESTGSNIFIVKKGILYTPIADCFLNGITRKTIVSLAKKNNINCNMIKTPPVHKKVISVISSISSPS